MGMVEEWNEFFFSNGGMCRIADDNLSPDLGSKVIFELGKFC